MSKISAVLYSSHASGPPEGEHLLAVIANQQVPEAMQLHQADLGLHLPGVHNPAIPGVPHLQHILALVLPLLLPQPRIHSCQLQLPDALIHVVLTEGNVYQLDTVSTAGQLVFGYLLQVGVEGVDGESGAKEELLHGA